MCLHQGPRGSFSGAGKLCALVPLPPSAPFSLSQLSCPLHSVFPEPPVCYLPLVALRTGPAAASHLKWLTTTTKTTATADIQIAFLSSTEVPASRCPLPRNSHVEMGRPCSIFLQMYLLGFHKCFAFFRHHIFEKAFLVVVHQYTVKLF